MCHHYYIIFIFCYSLLQILYNRTIVQLGMCAFRHGMIKESHDTLMDIHSPSRSKETKAKELAKELLAQVSNVHLKTCKSCTSKTCRFTVIHVCVHVYVYRPPLGQFTLNVYLKI